MTRPTLPVLFQRFEGLVVFVAAIVAFQASGYAWILFAVGLLAPDISMAGYLKNNVWGAYLYNLGHSYVLPVLLLLLGYNLDASALLVTGTIWIAHIGMDRAAGYGLKELAGFAHTHLGRINFK